MMVCSCNKTQIFPESEFADLTVNVNDGAVTKASGTAVIGHESDMNNIQVVVFDGSSLAGYATATSGSSVTLSLRTNRTYTACVVVNGPSVSGVNTISAIEATAADLDTYNKTNTGFVMYGKATMTGALTSSNKTLAVTVERRVCRVKLVSCTITPPTGVTASFRNAFISNVATNCNLGGTVTLNSTSGNSSNWYGRTTLSQTAIIDGNTRHASPEGLTYATGSFPMHFYSYANSNADAVTSFRTSWTATGTRLVVTATWNGTDYYYPVAIPNTVRNTCYDVTMTITGPGINDPQGEIPSNTNLTVNVSVVNWQSGNDYTASY